MKKLNKKGFTLIELLAVIAILAILVVISVPGILNMYNSGKKSGFQTQARNILKSIETDIVNKSLNSEPLDSYCFDGDEERDTLGLSSKSVYYNATIVNGEVTDLIVQQIAGSDTNKEVVLQAKKDGDFVVTERPDPATSPVINCDGE